jgi:hypothetical protein
MIGDKKHCVMLGMCFTAELTYLLRLSERFERDFTVSAYGFHGNDLNLLSQTKNSSEPRWFCTIRRLGPDGSRKTANRA